MRWRPALLLTALAVLLLGVQGATYARASSRRNRSWRHRRKICAKNDCAHLHVHENDNCVNRCTDAGCFEEVYGEEPLEAGEVDPTRFRAFTSCITRNIRQRKRLERAAKRAAGADNVDA